MDINWVSSLISLHCLHVRDARSLADPEVCQFLLVQLACSPKEPVSASQVLELQAATALPRGFWESELLSPWSHTQQLLYALSHLLGP